MQKHALEVKNISKMYNGKYVLRNINFNIYPGEIFGLIGPKGAGKSVLIRLIMGMAKPTDGEINVCGLPMANSSVKALENVGAVMQDASLYNFMTAKQNMNYYAKLLPNISYSRVNDVLAMFDLEDKMNQLVKTYSLDMKKRLNFAQALINEPKLLILDDPSYGLTEKSLLNLRQILKSLALEKNTAILITGHTLSEVDLLCDTVAFMDQGSIIESRTMSKLIEEISDNSKYRIILNYPNYSAKLLYLKYDIPVEVAGNSILIPYDDELLEEVKEALSSRDIQIYDIKEETKSLENIFIDIIKTKNLKK